MDKYVIRKTPTKRPNAKAAAADAAGTPGSSDGKKKRKADDISEDETAVANTTPKKNEDGDAVADNTPEEHTSTTTIASSTPEEQKKKPRRRSNSLGKQVDAATATKLLEHKGTVYASLEFPTITDFKSCEDHFNKIAEYLLNQTIMYINGVKHRIAEIEFYYTCEKHADPFTHGSDIQKTRGNWYFHKTGNNYRGGSFKGLDISIGGDNGGAIGGILIRSIEEIDSNTLIQGPSLVVDHILKLNKVDSIATFVTQHLKNQLSVDGNSSSNSNSNSSSSKNNNNNNNNNNAKETDAEAAKEKKKATTVPLHPLFLEYAPTTLKRREIFDSPRVGLTLKKVSPSGTDNRLHDQFIMKHYRYFSQPKQIKKGKHYMVLAVHHKHGATADQVCSILGAQFKTVNKYLDEYRKGKKTGPTGVSKFFGEELSTEDICNLYGCVSEYI